MNKNNIKTGKKNGRKIQNVKTDKERNEPAARRGEQANGMSDFSLACVTDEGVFNGFFLFQFIDIYQTYLRQHSLT